MKRPKSRVKRDLARAKGAQSPGAILEFAPTTLRELPAWFESLTSTQFDRIWVAAVVSTLAEDDDGGISIACLARVMTHVRERYRSMHS